MDLNKSSSNSPLKQLPSSSSNQAKGSGFIEKDEIDLLKSLFNSDETLIYDNDLSLAQFTNKVKSLKNKYHWLTKNKSSIKTTHDKEMYKIAHKIWGQKKMRKASLPTNSNEEKRKEKSSIEDSTGEDVINLNDYPFLMKNIIGVFSGGSLELYKEGLRGLGDDILKGLDERWRELEMENVSLEAKRAVLYYKHLESIGKKASN